MITETRTNTTTPDERPPMAQSEQQAEPEPTPPPALATDTTVEAAKREEPPLATPTAPPRETTGAQQPRPPSAGRWALALGLAVVGGFLTLAVGVFLAAHAEVFAIPIAILVAVTCLGAGLLLRSWWRLAVAVVVYVAVAALVWAISIVGAGDMQAWLVTFPLYVALPAVVMGAIGTALGMSRARRAA